MGTSRCFVATNGKAARRTAGQADQEVLRVNVGETCKRPRALERGAFCISIDVELAWGMWHEPDRDYMDYCARLERVIIERLLKLFERYEIAATWAIVGRLLERKWASSVKGDEHLWYAPDVVDRIQKAVPQQEVASHSFDHLYFHSITPMQALEDISAARRVHKKHGLEFASFVYPKNEVAYAEQLLAQGIQVFRGVDEGFYMAVARRAGNFAGRAANLVDKLVPTPPAVVYPVVHAGGLVELPSSMLLMSRRGLRRLVHPRMLVAKAKLGLRQAASKRGLFHLWFHPSNFYYDLEQQFETFDKILSFAHQLCEQGQLDIVPMKHFATPVPRQLSLVS